MSKFELFNFKSVCKVKEKTVICKYSCIKIGIKILELQVVAGLLAICPEM